MDKAHPIKTLVVVQSLDLEKDVFRPREEEEGILGSEFLSLIGAL
jgi:hypothetical protein